MKKLLLVCLAAATSPPILGADISVPLGPPAARLAFDGNLTEAVSSQPASSPAKVEFVPGHAGQAVRVGKQAVVFAAPKGFDFERGTVEMWFHPDTDCVDDTYRRFFDMEHAGKGGVYLIKSGAGGSNGLFLCAHDAAGKWRAASASPGRGYSWKPGQWHHIAGSWDCGRGLLELFFDGKAIATWRGEPFTLGPMGSKFAIGGRITGGESALGAIDDFALYQDVAAQSPIASARNCNGEDCSAWRAIDGDTRDTSRWAGRGALNWLEVELPQPIDLALVIVYPGALCYAQYPSTECSPREFTVQGWIGARWQPMSKPVAVPRYSGGGSTHRVVVDIEPQHVKRFRVWISSLWDEGKRVSSPDKPIVPAAERSVVIREIEWRSAQQVAQTKAQLDALRTAWQRYLNAWRGSDLPVARAVRQLYRKRLAELSAALDALAGADQTRIDAFVKQWAAVRRWLDPWKGCATGKLSTPWRGKAAGRLLVQVDPGDTPHEFYPASVAIDLRLVKAAFGFEVDPYRMEVIEVDAAGAFAPFDASKRTAGLCCPSRFDRVTPDRGSLVWTLRDRTHTRFVVQFHARVDGPPPAKGLCTLGNCDRFYFDEAVEAYLPSNLWSAVFVDWDGDGDRDALCGRWTDYAHLWLNVGSDAKPKFDERDHWLLVDEDDQPIAGVDSHHALGFSIVMPVDLDRDGRLDIFISNYYGRVPRFHRNLGPKAFPILSRKRMPIGLSAGRVAFGDLDGDGQPDAVVVHRRKRGDEVVFHAGRGLSPDGRPVFAKERKLGVEPERELFTSARTMPSLADIDGDGDLDLFLYTAPYLWQYDNLGGLKFAKGKRVERAGKPLKLGYYYPWASWSDFDGDGDLDLVKCTGLFVYVNEGDAKHLRLSKRVRPKSSRQKFMGRSGLKAHAMVDFDGDGDLDHVRLGPHGMDLLVSEWQDGLFRRTFNVEVDPNKRDWFGCPDPTEYYALYGNVKLVDWDSDGDLDLFVTSEHSWRFGYIHFYENLGGYKFGPEVRLRPDATCDYVRFVNGKRGQAALVDHKTFVDFLSYPTKRDFDPNGGTLRFWFQPKWRADDGEDHYLFYTEQNPATYGISNQDLKLYYIGLKTDLQLRPPFALAKTKAGTLRFQTWAQTLDTPKLEWQPGQWHRLEVGWGAAGRYIAVDGKRLAESAEPAKVAPVGRRVWIGCNSVMLVHREREYPARWRLHPIARVFPACGAFDDFEIADAAGKPLLTLSFDGYCDSAQGVSGRRTKVGYRCTPGFADLNGDGLLDMVMMIGDGRRGPGSKPEQRSWGLGRLYLFPNVGTKSKPKLGRGVLLRHADGQPFQCHIRTQITCVDWDRDGRVDIILSTENYVQAASNRTVDFFQNVGSVKRPVFGPRQPMDRLNELIDAHHEVKLCAVDLTGNGWADIVTSTDPGTRVTYRSYLDEAPVGVRFVTAERREE